MRTLPLLALLALFAPVQAQARPRTIPKIFAGNYGPTANLAPLGRTKVFIQTWYRGDNLQLGLPVLELGWRVHNTISAAAQAHTMEIVLGSTPATFSTLSKTFAANLGPAPVTFLALTTVNLPAQAQPADPDQPAVWIKGNRPFVFQGPHLLVQVDVQSAAAPTSTGYNCNSFTMASASTSFFLTAEKSCAGASLQGSHANGQLTLSLTGAPPSTPVFFLIGLDNARLGGSVPLPLDLGFLGMTGCVLALDPFLSFGASADATGAAAPVFPVALPPESLVLSFQALHLTAANPAGIGTTNRMSTILGGAGLCTYLYNWTVFGPTAESGPFAGNRGAVILLRP